jgi:hypothetical protein
MNFRSPIVPALFTAAVLTATTCTPLRADVLRYAVERRHWLLPTLSNAPIGISATFSASAQGTGLQLGYVWGSLETNALTGTNVVIATAVNFTPTTETNARQALDAHFPVGNYQLLVESSVTNPITGKVTLRTNTYGAAISLDFPATAPFATNVPPYSSLSASQTFSWPPWTANASSLASFTLYEGLVDTNLIRMLATNAAAVLTNLTVKAQIPNIAPTTTSVSVTGIDPALDHLVLLELSERNQVSTLPVGTTASSAIGIAIHPRQTSVPVGPQISATLTPEPTQVRIVVPGSYVALLADGTRLTLQSSELAGPWSDVATSVVPIGGSTADAAFLISPAANDHHREYRIVVGP